MNRKQRRIRNQGLLYDPPLPPRKAVVFIPPATRIMEASNEFHQGRAIWKRSGGIWTVIECAPCLNFLRKRDPASAKLELARRGFEFHWLGSEIDPACEAGISAVLPEPIRSAV